MNKEELLAFCDLESPKMCGPFSFGQYSFASNGHILVRVPRLVDVPEWDALNEKAAVLFAKFDTSSEGILLAPIPSFEPPQENKCPMCNGTGSVEECDECEGEGEVTLSNGHNSYECECKTCLGDGYYAGGGITCRLCDGAGKLSKHYRVAIGVTGFSSKYLSMLASFAGCRLAPVDPVGPNYFMWDGGDGLLMPMRA